jgi:glycosyltransferase involved in cell wall biosynthesis
MDLKKVTGIRYTAPIFDSSGYARASRDYILSLHNAGVPITVNPVSFEKARPNLGKNGQIIASLVNKPIEYNINLIHLTPEHVPIFKQPNKVNVNLTVWETDRIHRDWIDYCNQADALIVPCKWNIDVFRNSGVNKPMIVVPHGIDLSDVDSVNEKLEIEGLSDNDYVFYSVFQWNERKNPFGLLRAYYTAFAGRRDVALVLKTYGADNSDREIEGIVRNVMNIKKNITFYKDKPAPKVVLVTDLLSDVEIIKLHNRGDCYISLAHSEGFGLGYFHAMASRKPTIGVGGSGNEEFMNKDNSYLVDYSWSPTIGMPHFVWYTCDQMWPEPNMKDAIEKLQFVEANRDSAKEIGLKGRKTIEKYTWDRVADTMLSQLNSLIKD